MSELNVLLLRRTKIHWGNKQAEALVIACRVLELLQVLGKTKSAAKTTVTLPMTSNQLLWKINLWTRSVQITSNQLVSWFVKAIQPRMKGFKTLKKE